MSVQIIAGDCRDVLRTLPAESAHCCVTSPPYFGLRDYGCDGQIGLEQSPTEYVEQMVAVFREVRRVLRDDGGAGTTALVADRLQRSAVLVELNPDYIEIARRRIASDAPLFGDVRTVSPIAAVPAQDSGVCAPPHLPEVAA